MESKQTGFVRRLRAAAQVEAWQERVMVARCRDGWWRRSACAGLAAMVPEAVSEVAAAVEVCQGCPVRLSCLADARETERGGDLAHLYGVRGGLTGPQRAAVYSDSTKRPVHPLVWLVMDAERERSRGAA